MAVQDADSGRGFLDNLGKVYGLYTLGFLGVFAVMAILEQLGLGARAIASGDGWGYCSCSALAGP